MKLKRRIPQYFLGLILMCVGIVFAKRAALGISPITSLPAAVADLTPFSLGNTTIAFHLICFVVQFFITRKLDLKTILIIPLAFVFGYIIDFFMWLLQFNPQGYLMRVIVCCIGVLFNGTGVAIIAGADLMLPAPDAMFRALAGKLGKPHGKIKLMCDITCVALTIIIELIFWSFKLKNVGVGTLISAFGSGLVIGFVNRLCPWLKMPPLEFKKNR
ncbi:MAG: DUF6198 family protein [Oscillospiraceae bacterium]|nr:DUF6198 family protein [Oscillospiraceae bacterium]